MQEERAKLLAFQRREGSIRMVRKLAQEDQSGLETEESSRILMRNRRFQMNNSVDRTSKTASMISPERDNSGNQRYLSIDADKELKIKQIPPHIRYLTRNVFGSE